MGVFINIYTYH